MEYLIFLASAITAVCMVPTALKMFMLTTKTRMFDKKGNKACLEISVSAPGFPRILRGFKSNNLLISRTNFVINEHYIQAPDFSSLLDSHRCDVLEDIGTEEQSFFITVESTRSITDSSRFIARYNPIASTINIKLCNVTQM